MSAPSHEEEIITHGGVDRGYRLCRCSKCEHVSRCTPDNDFYTAKEDPNGLLCCERCVVHNVLPLKKT